MISHSWVLGNYSISPGIPLSCCKLDLIKCTVLEMERAPLKEEKIGVLVWHILSPHQLHLFSPDSAVSPGQNVWCAQPGQVPKTAHLPLLRARWT